MLLRQLAYQYQSPFHQYCNPIDFAQQPPSLSNPESERQHEKGLRGFGSRHEDDTAPFSLWDSGDHDFRNLTADEKAWIIRAYPGVTMISYNGPSLIIYTSTPPHPTPVTVAGVAAYFVPPDYQEEETIQVNTRYASPRIPDPLPHVRVPRLTKAKPQQMELILKALSEVADVKALNFVDYYLFVELRVNRRQYQIHSLPGIVAGLPTSYHQAEESIWGRQMDIARTRDIMPSTELGTQDTTDYLICGPLCPGVRLSLASATSSGTYFSVSRSTTAGVLLRNNLDHRRMTAALDGFLQSDQVFHPDHTGVCIEEINERWAGLDVALTRLVPSIQYTNEEYFGANPSKRLQYGSHALRGDWYEADGMSTGLVFFQLRGERLLCPPHLHGLQLTYRDLVEEHVTYAHTPSGGHATDGLCGAPIVSCDPATGAVLGFFHLRAGNICLVAVLNELIDRGWEVA